MPAAPPAAGEPRCFRVLVVDDDPIVAAGTVAMIEDLGHSAIEARSAAAALDVLGTGPEVDLVITDYAMPAMTGTQLAAAIRRNRPGLPVAIITGYADVPNQEVSLPRLAKPYRQQELASLIDALTAGRAANSGAVAGRSDRDPST